MSVAFFFSVVIPSEARDLQFFPSTELHISSPCSSGCRQRALEQVPQELVINLVVVLHLRSFDECAELPRAAVC